MPLRRLRSVIALGVAVVAICATLPSIVGASSEAPPKIAISSPKTGAVLHTSTVEVTGTFTVAPFNGPSPQVTATLNGKRIKTGVRGPVSYDFEGEATLRKGSNAVTVGVNDGNGGESTATVNVTYAPIQATRHQCVSDRSGDSSDHLTHMDIVRACALRSGARVIFTVTTAHPPPNIHDSFGNPAAPCIEIARTAAGQPGPAPIQSCGDGRLRGWTMATWPKVPFSIGGSVSKWKVPLKFLPKRSFHWRGYIGNADRYVDKAPNKGFLNFVVR
ncbi:MAG: Glucodextranase, domain [Solirubrobacterales bacterium]|nr:Glucodextranase, domain [Solirubrobacterales bacterium]